MMWRNPPEESPEAAAYKGALEALIRARGEALGLSPRFLQADVWEDLQHILLVAGEPSDVLEMLQDLAEDGASSGYIVVLDEGIGVESFLHTTFAVYDIGKLPHPWSEIIVQINGEG